MCDDDNADDDDFTQTAPNRSRRLGNSLTLSVEMETVTGSGYHMDIIA